jgi:hypothetical protein
MFWMKTPPGRGPEEGKAPRELWSPLPGSEPQWQDAASRASRAGIIGPSILIALATIVVGYAALWLTDILFKTDFRFWVVALKLMSVKQFLIFLIYLVPITAFFVIALHVLHRNFSTMDAGRAGLYLTNILALTLGFIVVLVLQYGTLWLTGKLFNPLPDPGFVPLSTIVAIQFVPLPTRNLMTEHGVRTLHLVASCFLVSGRPSGIIFRAGGEITGDDAWVVPAGW